MIASLIRVRSWQWFVAGILIGGFGALSVGMWGEPLLSAYGDSINGRRQFEEALTRQEAGRPWFTNLVVHAEQVGGEHGEKRTVHVVSGMFYDGLSEAPGQPGGGGPVWRPAF